MALGVVARRENMLWRAAAHLARSIYRTEYGADIDPKPDLFAVLQDETDVRGSTMGCTTISAAAGLTFGGDGHLLSEYYLAGSAESVLTPHLSERMQRSEIAEVGPLASLTPGDGTRLCSIIPLLAWCNGAKVIVCTITPRLGGMLPRLGIEFTPLVSAEESALPRRLQGGWGTYYESRPLTGYIDLRGIGQQLTENFGRVHRARDRAVV